MRRIAKLSLFLLASITFLSFALSQPPTSTFAANQRKIINIGVLVKFSNSDDIVPKRQSGAPFHIDDADNIENAQKLLNSDDPITMQTTAGAISVSSIKKYYEAQSYGKISITTELFPKSSAGQFIAYQDQHPLEYYLPKTSSNPAGYETNQKVARETELINHVIDAIKDQVAQQFSTTELDSNNDGKIDMLTLFVESAGSIASGGSGNILWPHFYNNSGSINITSQIAGMQIAGHSVIYHSGTLQQFGTFSLDTGGYGTIAHELGHALGFIDLYRPGNDPGQPVGIFDLMGKNSSSNPQNLSAYLVSEYSPNISWHNPLPVIRQTTKNITVSQPKFTDPNEQRAIKIQLDNSKSEYFVVEYYAPHDARENIAAKAKGIIVYRIDNSGSSDRVFVFRPNEPSLGAGAGDLLQAPLSSSRPSLGKALGGNQSFDNQTIYYSDGSNSGIIVTITSMKENSVTFDVNFPEIIGDGSEQNPYQISSPTTFIYLMSSDTKGKYYTITNNLDFKGIDYTRINFYGHLDGKDHTLSNINTTGAGVFDNLGDYNSASSVQSLKVTNLIVKPNSIGGSIGGLASAINNTTITNVHLLSGEVNNIKGINSLSATGGFAGNVDNKTTINNCSSALNVSADTNAGGFIGLNQNATIINSHTTGKVTGNSNLGAFIGIQYIMDEAYKTPQNSTYNSTINGNLPIVGTAYNPNATGSKFVTVPSNMLQGITNASSTTPEPVNPTPTPDPMPTENEVLTKLKLAKKQNYLFGFELGTSLTAMRQSFLAIKGVSIAELQANNSQTVATDIKLTLGIGNTTHNYILVIKGDVNGDGKIQATDYVKIRNHIMSKSQLTGASLQAADINQDGKVQATDYVKVRNHIMSKSIIEQK